MYQMLEGRHSKSAIPNTCLGWINAHNILGKNTNACSRRSELQTAETRFGNSSKERGLGGSALAIPGILWPEEGSKQDACARHSKALQQVECCQRCLLQLPVARRRMQCGNCGMPKDAKLSKPDANPAQSPPLMEHHMLKVRVERYLLLFH